MSEVKCVSLAPLGYSKYSITTDGRVLSHWNKQFRATHLDRRGYVRVGLKNDDGSYQMTHVHRLVARTFIPNPDNLPQVDHIDGVKTHNDVSNLRWMTNRQNAHAAMDRGLMPHAVFMNDEVVHGICRRLSQGDTVASICKDTGFSYDAVTAIRLRRNWTHISDQYVFPETKKQNYPSEEVIREMCRRILRGDKLCDICKELGLRSETVSRTAKGKIHKAIFAEEMKTYAELHGDM